MVCTSLDGINTECFVENACTRWQQHQRPPSLSAKCVHLSLSQCCHARKMYAYNLACRTRISMMHSIGHVSCTNAHEFGALLLLMQSVVAKISIIFDPNNVVSIRLAAVYMNVIPLKINCTE